MIRIFPKLSKVTQEVIVYNYLSTQTDFSLLTEEFVKNKVKMICLDNSFITYFADEIRQKIALKLTSGDLVPDLALLCPEWVSDEPYYEIEDFDLVLGQDTIKSSTLKAKIANREIVCENEVVTSMYSFFKLYDQAKVFFLEELDDKKNIYYDNDSYDEVESVALRRPEYDQVIIEKEPRFITYSPNSVEEELLTFVKDENFLDDVFYHEFDGEVKNFETSEKVKCVCEYHGVKIYEGYTDTILKTIVFDTLILNANVEIKASYTLSPYSKLSDLFYEATEKIKDSIQLAADVFYSVGNSSKFRIFATYDDIREVYDIDRRRGYILFKRVDRFYHDDEPLDSPEAFFLSPYCEDRDKAIQDIVCLFLDTCFEEVRHEYYGLDYSEPDDDRLDNYDPDGFLPSYSSDDDEHTIINVSVNPYALAATALYFHMNSLDEDQYYEEMFDKNSDLNTLKKLWYSTYDLLTFREQKGIIV